MSQDPRDARIAQLEHALTASDQRVNDLTRINAEFYAGLQGAKNYLSALPRSTPGITTELGLIQGALAYAAHGA